MSIRYRPDIDGLRALAVLPVVLYHASISPFSGGFTGVDIFFVISGYLITKIISDDLDAGRFSLRDFYERRVRRILPALLLMMAVVLVAGYVSLLPDQYKALAISTMHGVLFASNIFFAENTGYFDGRAHDMPLLHTWSLAIEEQYYLGWPLVLMALWYARARPRLFWSIIAMAGATSFALSVYGVATDAKDAFYLLPTRAWELLLGGALALWCSKTERHVPYAGSLSMLGLSLIGYGIFGLESGNPFPGYNALFPCLGAALIIWTGAANTPVRRLLSIAPMIFIGRISYSLYLWHWPIFVFYRLYANTRTLSTREAMALIVVSIIVAVLSWRFVEQPARQSRRGWRRHFAFAAAGMAVVGVAAVIIDEYRGMTNRLSPELAELSRKKDAWEWKCPHPVQIDGLGKTGDVCAIGAPWESASVKGVLWGDSHAEHFAPILDGVARDANVSLILWRSCPAYIDNEKVKRFYPSVTLYSERCGEARTQALNWLENTDGLQLVVLAAAWTSYPPTLYVNDSDIRSREQGLKLMEAGMTDLLAELHHPDRHIIILSDVPRPAGDIAACYLLSKGGLIGRQCDAAGFLEVSQVRSRLEPTNTVLERAAAHWEDVEVIPTAERMCGEETCPSHINGEFIYWDGGHLRRNLSEQTERSIAKMIGLDEALRSID